MFSGWPHPHLLWAMGGILGILVLATVIVSVLAKRNPERDLSELKSRVKSWWVMATVFAVAMSLSRTVSLGFFAFLSFLALKEYLSVIPTRRADRRVLFWVYLAVPVQYLWAGYSWYEMFIIFIPVYAFLFVPVRMLLIGETKGYLTAVGTLHWGLMTTVFSLSHLAYMLVLPRTEAAPVGGPGLALYLVVLTQLNDVAQYVWGKSFGKHKVAPTVSPGKTAEGLLGGVLTTMGLAVLLAPLLTPLEPLEALTAGFIIGVAGFFGDLSISAIKRDLGRKDSSDLIPGHGGILDRIDSISYTAPLFFHFMWWLHY